MELQQKIIETLKKEVVPAMGCTEPVAVALCCAKAKELIDSKEDIKKVQVLVSPNIYKNGLCVGIPNTKEVGLLIAAALGIVGGDSKKRLQVLEGIHEEDVKQAKKLIDEERLSLDIYDTEEKVYVNVMCFTDHTSSQAVIMGKHDQFVYLKQDEETILDDRNKKTKTSEEINPLYDLKIRDIIKAIEKIPHGELTFLLDGLMMNEKIAKVGLNQKLGMGVGACFYEDMQKGILSDDLMHDAMMLTAAASDARMSGINMSVMSSNGSGNNGLTAILPIVAYKNKFNVEDEKITKALAISHIMNSYIKHYIGRLSAICGCGVAAATGAGVAIAWLMGGNDEQIDGVIKNMLANVSGMICDGAKAGCALKLATSASTAVQSALLALNGRIVPDRNGIIAKTAEETIKNLGTLSSKGMGVTDHVILEVMQGMEVSS